MDLRDTLRSLADLVLDIERHEALAEVGENEYLRQIEAMRSDVEKGRRIAKAREELDAETLALHETERPPPQTEGGTR